MMRALVYVLEGSWWSTKESPIVLPYLSALTASHRGIEIAHRTIRSADDIAHYVSRIPSGAKAFLYIACHGDAMHLYPVDKRSSIPMADVLEALSNAKNGAVSFVHFGCCGMVDAAKRRRAHQSVLDSTGAHRASGYTGTVDWLQSTLLDLALIADVFQPYIADQNKMGPKIKHRANQFIRDYDRRSPISIATGGWGILEENFGRGAEAKAGAGTVVELVFYRSYRWMRDLAKVSALGKILA